MGKVATCLPSNGVISDMFPWVCWYIWIARNQLIFEGRHITLEDTISKAIWSVREWNMAQPTTPIRTQTYRSSSSLITPGLKDLITCFSDAAWRHENNMAWFKCSFKNKAGGTDHQASRLEQNIASPLVAEALALRWALLTAYARVYSRICFNTDSIALSSNHFKGSSG